MRAPCVSMQLITLNPSPQSPAAGGAERAGNAMGGIIGCLGEADFSSEALAHLNRWLPVAWWSVYRLYDDAPPTLHANASFRYHDGTGESWQAYRAGLYRSDETFLAAREQATQAGPLLVHWHAREIPRPHREHIYIRHGLTERLSLVCRDKDEALLAVNLYRHEEHPAFSDEEIEAMGGAAGLLLSCVRKHIALSHPPQSQVLAALPRREREVCERMLKGWTHEGIAADLGLSAATVKTYRDRAFDRLGIRHRNELFALVAGHRD